MVMLADTAMCTAWSSSKGQKKRIPAAFNGFTHFPPSNSFNCQLSRASIGSKWRRQLTAEKSCKAQKVRKQKHPHSQEMYLNHVEKIFHFVQATIKPPEIPNQRWFQRCQVYSWASHLSACSASNFAEDLWQGNGASLLPYFLGFSLLALRISQNRDIFLQEKTHLRWVSRLCIEEQGINLLEQDGFWKNQTNLPGFATFH